MCGSRVAMTPQWCCGYERDAGTAAAAEAGRCAAAFRFIPLHHIPFQSHESLLRTLRITSHSMTPHPDGIRGGRGAARARHDGCRRRERGTRGTMPSHMTSHTIAIETTHQSIRKLPRHHRGVTRLPQVVCALSTHHRDRKLPCHRDTTRFPQVVWALASACINDDANTDAARAAGAPPLSSPRHGGRLLPRGVRHGIYSYLCGRHCLVVMRHHRCSPRYATQRSILTQHSAIDPYATLHPLSAGAPPLVAAAAAAHAGAAAATAAAGNGGGGGIAQHAAFLSALFAVRRHIAVMVSSY